LPKAKPEDFENPNVREKVCCEGCSHPCWYNPYVSHEISGISEVDKHLKLGEVTKLKSPSLACGHANIESPVLITADCAVTVEAHFECCVDETLINACEEKNVGLSVNVCIQGRRIEVGSEA